eukprot:scaffold243383_cov27-Tisochrysis_lutea.AAC.3
MHARTGPQTGNLVSLCRYGMIEAIAHLINRDYSEIGQDFVNLEFIPEGVDTEPIVPALARVFDAALAGGGAKSINFQELAADLAEVNSCPPCPPSDLHRLTPPSPTCVLLRADHVQVPFPHTSVLRAHHPRNRRP